jgi:hypothetical protein
MGSTYDGAAVPASFLSTVNQLFEPLLESDALVGDRAGSPISVRGFLAGVVRKKLGLTLLQRLADAGALE